MTDDVYDDAVWAEARNEKPVDANALNDKPEGYSCEECGNEDPHGFETDDERGEVVCLNCGYLVEENLIDLSAPTPPFQFRRPFGR